MKYVLAAGLGFAAGVLAWRQLCGRAEGVQGRIGEVIHLPGQVRLHDGELDVVKVYSGKFRPVPLLRDVLKRLEGRHVQVTIQVLDPEQPFKAQAI